MTMAQPPASLEGRYIPNDFPSPLTVSNTESYLKAALEDIVANYPPLDSYEPPDADSSGPRLFGLWTGPTGIAYLFLHVSVARPALLITSHPASHWAAAYIRGARGPLKMDNKCCGLGSEKLCWEAVRACVTKDLGAVKAVVANVPEMLTAGDAFPDELLYGRAGALYLLRMIRHWVPSSAPLVEGSIVRLTERVLESQGKWTYYNERYLGAVHGDASIITQLVLTTPPIAKRLEPEVKKMLEWQLPDGNWPATEGASDKVLTQFCHGAPGMVLTLLSLRPYYPQLEVEIDTAIKKGREATWKYGLLKKEPNICHGILGNALVFPSGQQRDHFLALATPKKLEEMRAEDKTMFEPAAYGATYSTVMSYTPSAAWTWMVYGQTLPKTILYDDI